MTSRYFNRTLSNIRDKLIKGLSGGVEGKPHSSKEGREAQAKRTFGRIVQAGGLRSKTKKK